MRENPIIHYPLWKQDVTGNIEETHFYLKWKSKGFELCFCQSNLHTAWMYNDKVNGFNRYIGELPENLNFTDTLEMVEKKLGKPDHIIKTPPQGALGMNVEVKFDHIYKKKGLCVSFNKPPNGDAVITAIALFPPGDAPCW